MVLSTRSNFLAFFTLSKKTFNLLCNEEKRGLELAHESCQTYCY